MLIMRRCFLFPNVFVLPIPAADFASKKIPVCPTIKTKYLQLFLRLIKM